MAVDWSTATVLSLLEFDVAWQMLDLGETPVALELPGHGATDVERNRLVRQATDSLRDRGLVQHLRPSPELQSELRLLATAEAFRDLVVTAPSRLLAVVGSSGGRAVLAVCLDERVALVRLPTERATTELVELLGPIAPGPGRQVRVPQRVLGEAMAACGADRERFASELMRRGLDGADAYALLRMSEVIGVGQLGASRRTVNGRRRAPYALVVQSTAEGCYRQRRVPLEGADTMVEAGPADARSLALELEELVTILDRPAARATR